MFKIMNYEPVQEGNPHQLTVRQHVFPVACIKRFVNLRNNVRVFYTDIRQSRWRSPTHDTFCAMRKWDQQTESDFMKEVEDNYHEIADSYFMTPGELRAEENNAVTAFYLLWLYRAKYRDRESLRIKLKTVDSTTVTKDTEELMEKNNVLTVASDGTVSMRHFIGMDIMDGVEMNAEKLNIKWRCLHFDGGNLIVPDRPTQLAYIPLAPRKAFIGFGEGVTKPELMTPEFLNGIVNKDALKYKFQFDAGY